MRRFLIALFFSFTFACTGLAQQTAADSPATKEDVETYLKTIHAHEMIHTMMDAMSKPMHQLVHDQYMRDKDKLPADFEERMNRMMDDMLKGMPWDDMVDAMVPAYQKHFTKGDIDALVAFYSTPTGQKILREMPAISAEAMQDMMPTLRKYMDNMNARVQQEMTEMVKNSKTKPAEKPATAQP